MLCSSPTQAEPVRLVFGACKVRFTSTIGRVAIRASSALTRSFPVIELKSLMSDLVGYTKQNAAPDAGRAWSHALVLNAPNTILGGWFGIAL